MIFGAHENYIHFCIAQNYAPVSDTKPHHTKSNLDCFRIQITFAGWNDSHAIAEHEVHIWIVHNEKWSLHVRPKCNTDLRFVPKILSVGGSWVLCSKESRLFQLKSIHFFHANRFERKSMNCKSYCYCWYWSFTLNEWSDQLNICMPLIRFNMYMGKAISYTVCIHTFAFSPNRVYTFAVGVAWRDDICRRRCFVATQWVRWVT